MNAVKAGLIGDADEELRAAAVGIAAGHTAETAPRVFFSAFRSARKTPSPPVPYDSTFDGSFVNGSPPWTIPCRTT